MSTIMRQRAQKQTGALPPTGYRPLRGDLGRLFGSAVANSAAVGEIFTRERIEALQVAVRRQPVQALALALGAGWVVGRIVATGRRRKVS